MLADPVSGVMPWDEVPASTSVLPAQSSQPEHPDQFASSTTGLLEPTAELSGASEAAPLVEETPTQQDALIDQVPVESSSSPSLPISSSGSSSPIALHDAEPASLPLIHEEMSGVVSASPGSEWGVASLPISQDFANTISNETTRVAEAVQPPQSDASSTLPSPTSDALPAPLPWEQVQETTVAIPQPDGRIPLSGFPERRVHFLGLAGNLINQGRAF